MRKIRGTVWYSMYFSLKECAITISNTGERTWGIKSGTMALGFGWWWIEFDKFDNGFGWTKSANDESRASWTLIQYVVLKKKQIRTHCLLPSLLLKNIDPSIFLLWFDEESKIIKVSQFWLLQLLIRWQKYLQDQRLSNPNTFFFPLIFHLVFGLFVENVLDGSASSLCWKKGTFQECMSGTLFAEIARHIPGFFRLEKSIIENSMKYWLL